jgi:histidinol phosphatase-like enzyme (inositol monophosphatase family)
MSELTSRLEFALSAAAEASELILSFYQRSDLVVESKRDASPVTEADRGAEQLIRRRIAESFPNDAILGEEFGESPGSSGYRWILDPVDGTKSFIHGVPLFGTLIGLEQGTECVAGVCRIPPLNEVVYAAKGQGAWWQIGGHPRRPARVSAISNMSQATICTTDLDGWHAVNRQDTYEKVLSSSGLSRGWGDCYGHILVATGRAEVMYDPRLNPWDCAALVPILQEAGGHFLDWNGASSIYSGNGFSVNAALKNEVIQLLS